MLASPVGEHIGDGAGKVGTRGAEATPWESGTREVSGTGKGGGVWRRHCSLDGCYYFSQETGEKETHRDRQSARDGVESQNDWNISPTGLRPTKSPAWHLFSKNKRTVGPAVPISRVPSYVPHPLYGRPILRLSPPVLGTFPEPAFLFLLIFRMVLSFFYHLSYFFLFFVSFFFFFFLLNFLNIF